MLRETGSRRTNYTSADGHRAAQSFIDALGVAQSFRVDEPKDPAGEWWFDIVVDGVEINVAWRPDKGFGLYSTDESAYGAGPDEVFRSPELAAKRLLQILRPSTEKRKTSYMRLKDIRNLVNQPQTSVADKMHVGQSVISRLENQNDALLSTVSQYVSALGGKMKVVVSFDGFDAPIEMPDCEESAIPGVRL